MEQHVSGTNLDPVPHVYAASGTYQVKIRGGYKTCRVYAGGDNAKVIYLDNWGNIDWDILADAFQTCYNMQGRYVDVPNMTSVTSLSGTFYACSKFNYTVNFDTSHVTNFSNFLRRCSIFNQPININTSAATTMQLMLSGANAFNQDVSGLNYEAITGAGLNDFISNAAPIYSTAYYDALLISLAAQNVHNTVTFGVQANYTPGGAAEAARTHLVSVHGWTITDDGPSFSNGLLVLNFDDGGSSQYVAFEDLVAQGEKATFYLISNAIGTGSNLTWAQVQTMLAAGMDIQCHTYDHTNLQTLTEAQVYAEYDDLDAQFVANGIPAAHHTSYPYGLCGGSVQAYTATRRLTARTVNQGYVLPNTTKTYMPAYPMDAATDYEALKAAMLVAQGQKWAILAYGHGIGGSQIPRDKFNEIIDYAQSIGMTIATVSEMYAEMTP